MQATLLLWSREFDGERNAEEMRMLEAAGFRFRPCVSRRSPWLKTSYELVQETITHDFPTLEALLTFIAQVGFPCTLTAPAQNARRQGLWRSEGWTLQIRNRADTGGF